MTLPSIWQFTKQIPIASSGVTALTGCFEALGIEGAAAGAMATAGISLIIAAVIGLGALLVKFIKDNTPEAKLEKLQEGAEAAAQAADDAATAYKNLTDTLDGLDDQYKALEQLTKGTRE